MSFVTQERMPDMSWIVLGPKKHNSLWEIKKNKIKKTI